MRTGKKGPPSTALPWVHCDLLAGTLPCDYNEAVTLSMTLLRV